MGYNQKKGNMGNTNTFWESGTRLGSLPVGKTGKQMIGDREMSENCRSPKRPLAHSRKFEKSSWRRRYLNWAGAWGWGD